MLRREFLKRSGALPLLVQPQWRHLARADEMPAEVAGVRLPATDLAARAAAYARANCPDYLFNHCMRTFLFGALQLKRQRRAYAAEDAFVAAALHDLGLVPAFESARASFEIDGADAAERWVRKSGGSALEADRVWFAVELHDGAWALTRRQGPEAMLVSLGAALDVDGPRPGDLQAGELEEVVAAFPRLRFKRRFTQLLVAHCERKPDSQRATWLEGLCRAHGAHPVPDDAVEQQIAAAGFTE
jgi:hypothetical protein